MDHSVIKYGVPGFVCPEGTKMHILNLGSLEVDEGWILMGANGGSSSNPNPTNKRRKLMLIAGLIEYPGFGLILFETGCAQDVETKWDALAIDMFPRTNYDNHNKLPEAIKATGNDIADVRAVILGHLHMDHAGGLEHFVGTNVPIYVHEEEFKHACWAAATGSEGGLYLADYLNLAQLKWETFNHDEVTMWPGITLFHTPGHTPGLCMMQVNLKNSGMWLWTTDQYHVRENYHDGHAHGWLIRDHRAWLRSDQRIKRMQKLFDANLIFGHDYDIAQGFIDAQKFYD